MNVDPRIKLSEELTPSQAAPALEALDRSRVILRCQSEPQGPANALGAASMLALVSRTHAYVELDRDVALPPNPWSARSLHELHGILSAVRPAPAASPTGTLLVDIGQHPEGSHCHARLRIGGDTWTAVTTGGDPVPPFSAPEPTAIEPSAPYGMLLAAGFGAAHLFREALRPLGLPGHRAGADMLWNILTYRRSVAPEDLAQRANHPRWPPLAWLGCGSVNSSAVAALACENLRGLNAWTIDGDSFDLGRNAFRYPASAGTELGGKAEWLSGILKCSGASSSAHTGPVRDWVRTRPAPGFHGIAICSVDSIDGRYEGADLLAQTTLSAAISGMALHLQREHLGDGYRCPYCNFVDLRTPLSQAAVDAELTGLTEQRIIELLQDPQGLSETDINLLIANGKVPASSGPTLLGRRIADLRARIYAEGLIPATSPGAAPTPVSAPFVSWVTGVLCAGEIAKAARSLPMINRRVELDLHGLPDDFVYRLPQDNSGRCACASIVRRRWMHQLYPGSN